MNFFCTLGIQKSGIMYSFHSLWEEKKLYLQNKLLLKLQHLWLYDITEQSNFIHLILAHYIDVKCSAV